MELGRCREHPEREARVTPCIRCGDFRCEECFEFDAEVGLCSSCVPTRLPWAKEQSPRALWQTFVLVVTDGPRVFSTAVGTGEPQHAPSFAGWIGVAGFAPWLLLLSMGMLFRFGDDICGMFGALCGSVAFGAPFIAIGQLIRGGLYGGLYHLAARALGGRASFGSSLDATYLSMAVSPFIYLSYVLLLIPLAGAFIVLGVTVVAVGWGVFLVVQHARARHGLSPARATLAAVAPFSVFVVAWVGIIALAMLRFMQLSGR